VLYVRRVLMKIAAIIPGANYTKANYNMSFLGSKFSLTNRFTPNGEEFKQRQAELDKEAAQAQKARGYDINVPSYKIKTTEDGHVKQIRYKTEGDTADVETNPIKRKHFRSLFKNLYYLDRAGIFHNDLDKSHIFFRDDGQVELDCFRYSVNFYKARGGMLEGNDGSIRTPDFMFPSNEDCFKEQCLAGYVENLEENDKDYFIRLYLRNSSEYHNRRAELLVKRGFSPLGKTVQYETIQSEVFANPSYQVVNYEIDKLKAYKSKREAFTEWDEGGGACGHEISPERRFNAILMHLDCIDDTMVLRDEAEYFSKNASTEAERRYFQFETECIQKRLDDLYNDTKGMGGWNFNDSKNKIYLGTKDEKEFFLALYDEIDTSNTASAEDSIKDVREYYIELKERWNEDLNRLYMEDCTDS